MSHSSVFVLALLVAVANAATSENKQVKACATYYYNAHVMLCNTLGEMQEFPGKVFVNTDPDPVKNTTHVSRIPELIKLCCYESCSIHQILSFC